MSAPAPDPLVCLAQADLCLLLARMLESPSDWADSERDLARAELEDLAERSGLASSDPLLQACSAWRSAEVASTALEANRLFEGAAVCPPNETIHVRRDKGAVLADIAGFYRAFGFDLAPDFREKHDHAVAQLQFTAMLLVLVARAAEPAQSDRRRIAHRALRGFLGDHLGLWIDGFAERLRRVSSDPLYRRVAGLLTATWEALRASHVPAMSEPIARRFDVDSGTPYECGRCAAEVAEPASSGESKL